MSKFAVAVKAFIVNEDKVLLLKRRPNDVHKPGVWDIPGGRLALGENPYLGVQREGLEEVNLKIKVKAPLDIHHFTRDDGQVITMIIFLCTPQRGKIKLSAEHTDYLWAPVDKSRLFPDWIRPTVQHYRKLHLSKKRATH